MSNCLRFLRRICPNDWTSRNTSTCIPLGCCRWTCTSRNSPCLRSYTVKNFSKRTRRARDDCCLSNKNFFEQSHPTHTKILCVGGPLVGFFFWTDKTKCRGSEISSFILKVQKFWKFLGYHETNRSWNQVKSLKLKADSAPKLEPQLRNWSHSSEIGATAPKLEQ